LKKEFIGLNEFKELKELKKFAEFIELAL